MRWRAILGEAAFVVALVTPNAARADVIDCGSVIESAGRTESGGKLLDARTALVACSEQCEGAVRDECTRRASDVLERTPTILVQATDRQGTEITDVAVAIDGAIVAQELDGKAIAVDPGAHRIVLNRRGVSVNGSVVVEERVKAKALHFVIRSASDLDGPARDLRGHTVWPWAIVGLGAAFAASGIAIILTTPELPTGCDENLRTCRKLPNETQQGYEQRQDQAGSSVDQPVIGGLLIGIGALIAAGGLTWHFLEPTEPRPPTAGGIVPRLSPWLGREGGGGFAARGVF
jgi:hypothetical protein